MRHDDQHEDGMGFSGLAPSRAEAVAEDRAKTVRALKAEIERLKDENALLHAAIGFAHEQGFEWPADPLAFINPAKFA